MSLVILHSAPRTGSGCRYVNAEDALFYMWCEYRRSQLNCASKLDLACQAAMFASRGPDANVGPARIDRHKTDMMRRPGHEHLVPKAAWVGGCSLGQEWPAGRVLPDTHPPVHQPPTTL